MKTSFLNNAKRHEMLKFSLEETNLLSKNETRNRN